MMLIINNTQQLKPSGTPIIVLAFTIVTSHEINCFQFMLLVIRGKSCYEIWMRMGSMNNPQMFIFKQHLTIMRVHFTGWVSKVSLDSENKDT